MLGSTSQLLFWVSVVVFVIGIFMLIAGIGPLWLPILVVLVGIAGGLIAKFKPELISRT